MKRFGLVFLVVMACSTLPAQAQTKPPEPTQEKVEAVPITRETLEARLVELERAKTQAIANVNAYAGAIQECKYWLEQIKAAEKAKEAPPPSPSKKEETKKEPEVKKP